jgi:hypothetical protein
MPLPVNKIVEAMARHRLTPLQQAQQAFGKGVMLANLLSDADKDIFIGWAQVQLMVRGMTVTVTSKRTPVPSRHVCGLQGYDGMRDPPCPGCEDRNALASNV